jgi:hypothetical protein
MRNQLLPYLGKTVACSGWIERWDDHLMNRSRQILTINVEVRVPNPDLRYQDLEIACKIDHLNLFVPFEILPSYDVYFVRLVRFNFYGEVRQYVRSNGLTDLAIMACEQLPLHYQIAKLKSQLNFAICDSRSDTDRLIKEIIVPEVHRLGEQLQLTNLNLDTSKMTRNEMISALDHVKLVSNRILSAMKTRTYRRRFDRVKQSPLEILQNLQKP